MDLLRELELPEGGKRFELATENDDDHHHLICVPAAAPKSLRARGAASRGFSG